MKGVMFKPDMIRAIAAGRKTQTRRLMRPDFEGHFHYGSGMNKGMEFPCLRDGTQIYPRYRVGETVYIKEAHAIEKAWDDKPLSFLANAGDVPLWYQTNDPLVSDFVPRGKWRSPPFMQEWAARYFIQITAVRAERLQEITGDDAFAEGCGDIGIVPINTAMLMTNTNTIEDCHKELAIAQYQMLWDSINKKVGTRWETNPFVWVYTFKRVRMETSS